MWKSINVDKFILYVPYLYFTVPMITKEDLKYDITQIEKDRVRIIITLNEEVELGTLYFEKAKRGFINKPIGLDAWACVDAKVEGLYIAGGENITPKDMVQHCQDLLRQAGIS